MKKLNKIIVVLAIFFGVLSCQPEVPREYLEFPIKEYIVDVTSDTTLFGDQGTRIFIGRETFQFQDGKIVTDSIKIELKEFYKKSDIILAELSTESNGIILETGGMLHIRAMANGEELEIRPDKRIVVHFPKEGADYRQMNLFYADESSTDTVVNNWNVDTVNLVKRTLKLGSFGWWYPGPDDSTSYSFTPRNYVDTGYYWNPLDFYVCSYDFSEETIKEVETTLNSNTFPDFDSWNDFGVECRMYISREGYIETPIVVTGLSSRAKKEILQFLRDLPQLEPGKDKDGDIIERRGLIFIEGGNIIPLYKTDEEYLKSFDEKYSKYEANPIKSMDDAELNYYIFSVSELGWINCDRFLDFEEKVDLITDFPVSTELQLKLVFSDINGVLKPDIVKGKYVFFGVPKGQNATLIGIKSKEGRFSMAFHDFEISENPIQELQFSETTLSELRERLSRYND
ncbi:hypothetical protein [Lewinella sp. LCG006]|uniref:hypothetical protein n=1 Tax=Lewinella sp. LCG006 TaxID=3231911 RepID=UPI00345FBAD8